MQTFKVAIILLAVVVASVVARPSSESSKRLIKTSETDPGKWLSEEEVLSLVQNKVHFMDITDRTAPEIKTNAASINAFPTSLRYNSSVLAALPILNVTRIESFIVEFSSFHNRYYNNANGVEAAAWLYNQVNATIAASGYQGNVTVRAFDHSWLQPSTIARIQGSEDGLVVIGAHMDSINSLNSVNGLAPGADDNASGSAALLEAFRSLLESGFLPKKSIEFQWYAAEEIGLRGSQDIAQKYFSDKVNVTGMLNFDVVGYKSRYTEVSFLTDYTDRDLNQFLRLVVEGYLEYTWTNSVCGYGCSDHASWNSFGFPAASPSEPELSPYMHTVLDTVNTVDYNMVKEFAKLAVGYSIEVSEPRA